jgi:hypothetical protein
MRSLVRFACCILLALLLTAGIATLASQVSGDEIDAVAFRDLLAAQRQQRDLEIRSAMIRRRMETRLGVPEAVIDGRLGLLEAGELIRRSDEEARCHVQVNEEEACRLVIASVTDRLEERGQVTTRQELLARLDREFQERFTQRKRLVTP